MIQPAVRRACRLGCLATGAEELAIRRSDIEEIRSLFPAGTVVLAAPVRDHMAALHPSEATCVVAAASKRKAEFSTGRALAAHAMRLLQQPGQAILQGDSNEPLWPEGIVGSITHNSRKCLVALAFDHVCSGIGIDVEESGADVGEIAHLIMRADEWRGAHEPASAQDDARVRLTFSVKESIFKAVYARWRHFVEFDEVRLEIDACRNMVCASAPENEPLNRLVIPGRGGYIHFDDLLVTGFYIPVGAWND